MHLKTKLIHSYKLICFPFRTLNAFISVFPYSNNEVDERPVPFLQALIR